MHAAHQWSGGNRARSASGIGCQRRHRLDRAGAVAGPPGEGAARGVVRDIVGERVVIRVIVFDGPVQPVVSGRLPFNLKVSAAGRGLAGIRVREVD